MGRIRGHPVVEQQTGPLSTGDRVKRKQNKDSKGLSLRDNSGRSTTKLTLRTTKSWPQYPTTREVWMKFILDTNYIFQEDDNIIAVFQVTPSYLDSYEPVRFSPRNTLKHLNYISGVTFTVTKMEPFFYLYNLHVFLCVFDPICSDWTLTSVYIFLLWLSICISESVKGSKGRVECSV